MQRRRRPAGGRGDGDHDESGKDGRARKRDEGGCSSAHEKNGCCGAANGNHKSHCPCGRGTHEARMAAKRRRHRTTRVDVKHANDEARLLGAPSEEGSRAMRGTHRRV